MKAVLQLHPKRVTDQMLDQRILPVLKALGWRWQILERLAALTAFSAGGELARRLQPTSDLDEARRRDHAERRRS